jgi:type IV pilus assembly protein PilW
MPRYSSRRRSCPAQGFSLIELLVAMAITLFVVMALTALFTNNSTARREIENSGQQVENGRYALELIRDDLRLAGYYGEITTTYSNVSWQLPANPCDPTLANLGFDAATTALPVAVSGFEGHDAAIAAMSPQCLSNRVTNSDVLVVRRVSTTATSPAPTSGNVAYVQASLQTALCSSSEATFVFDIPRSPTSYTLHQGNCATIAPVRQYLVHIYYVSSCDDCASNDGVPTLKRVELAGDSMTTVSLVQGIADMRVDYGLDTNNDGFPDVFKKCGADATYSGPCSATDWSNAMMVKVYLLARHLETTAGYVDDKTYDMGLAGTLPAFTGDASKYKRHVYSTPIRLVNVSDRRELP